MDRHVCGLVASEVDVRGIGFSLFCRLTEPADETLHGNDANSPVIESHPAHLQCLENVAVSFLGLMFPEANRAQTNHLAVFRKYLLILWYTDWIGPSISPPGGL